MNTEKNTVITAEDIAGYTEAYRRDEVRQVMAPVISGNDLSKLAYSADGARKLTFHFSNEIKTMKATAQNASGRCWLFAACNVFREKLAAALDIENFELSQSYLAFWDKFERCNYYLEAIRETAGLPVDDRTVNHLFKEAGVSDGGQWDMFISLVRKYGLVPKEVMPETYQSSNTRPLNRMLSRYMRKCGLELRELVRRGESAEAVEAWKKGKLSTVWAFLVNCYGEMPEHFDFEYTDKKGNYNRVSGLTPQSFRDQYFADEWDQYVSVINAPTYDKPFHRMYTVQYLGNVVEDGSVKHLNLPMEELKAAILRQLLSGEIVWFGSDCGKFSDREKRIFDDGSFLNDRITGLDSAMTKEEMLMTNESKMNHAMCLTGVNLDRDGNPQRWKIENSWGPDGLYGGYFIASDSWLEQYVFQAVIKKEFIGPNEAYLQQEPIVLKPWDPMGSLA